MLQEPSLTTLSLVTPPTQPPIDGVEVLKEPPSPSWVQRVLGPVYGHPVTHLLHDSVVQGFHHLDAEASQTCVSNSNGSTPTSVTCHLFHISFCKLPRAQPLHFSHRLCLHLRIGDSILSHILVPSATNSPSRKARPVLTPATWQVPSCHYLSF